MAVIQILYDGDDITADVRFADARFAGQAGGQPGQAALRVRDKGHVYLAGYFHSGGTLELWVDGRREWDGWVMTVAREYAFPVDITTNPQATPRYWALEGYDRNFLFLKRYHYNLADPANFFIGDYPAGTSAQSVVLDILANYTPLSADGLDIVSGITDVGLVDPYEKINVVETGMAWQTFMQKISLFNGAVFYIDPDRVVRLVSDTADTAPFALSDEPGPGDVGYRDMTIRFSAAEMANEAFIWGVGVGSADPAFAHSISDDAIAEHGLWQYGETVQGMYTELSVQRRADVLINGSPSHAFGHRDETVRIECTIFEPGLRVGMGVSFHSGAWDMGDLVNITPGVPPAYEPGNFNKATEFDQLLFWIRHFESNSNYDPHHQNKRSKAMGAYQIMPRAWAAWAPLALGLPRSAGVASQDLDVDFWYPPPTADNQETVARWRLGLLYQHKGQDPRRVAASWKGGPSVGAREPNTWSRGIFFYVNHICMKLGYPETTPSTVLDPITEPEQDYVDYQTPTNSDDVYPVRKMEMTFPTPTSVRYTLLLSHELDAAWSYKDPLPPTHTGPTDPGGEWYSEIITLDGYSNWYQEPQPGDSGFQVGDEFFLGNNGFATRGVYGHNEFLFPNEAWIQTGPESYAGQGSGPGIYSAVGRGHGIQNVLETVPQNPCGDDAFTNYEDAEAWYGPINAAEARANLQYPIEMIVGNNPQLIMGHVPSLIIRASRYGPGQEITPGVTAGYGNGTAIGEIVQITPGAGYIHYRPDWATAYGFPAMEATFSTFIIPQGTLEEGMWLSVSPGWQCQRMEWPSFFCDTGAEAFWGPDSVATACNNRGPECSGVAQSGRFSGPDPFGFIKLRLLPVSSRVGGSWTTNPGANNQNGPVNYWVDGMYRTLYPYASNTLQVTWQGVNLTKGVEVIEVDPSNGIFQITGLGSGEGSITVRYYVPANSAPTVPIPGEPGTTHDPLPPGTVGGDAAAAVIHQAYSFIGTPYQVGSESREKTDCSGLVFQCFRDAGYGYLVGDTRKLAAGYTRYFADKGMFTRSLAAAQPGDLIVYSHNGVHVAHIGIYLGGGMIISALIPPWGVTKTKVNLPGIGFYGVLMVPYDRARSSTDTTSTSDSDPEDSPTADGDDVPPQTPPPLTGVVYRPRSQSQLGYGTASDGANGLMACSAMLLDRHTLGAHTDLIGAPLSTPPAHRDATETNTPHSTLTFDDVVHAWATGWDDEPVVFSAPLSWAAFKSEITHGRGAIVLGLTSALPANVRKSQATGAYALYVNEQLPDGSFWVCDPITRGALLYPESALKAFTSALMEGDDAVSCIFSLRTPTT
jgi:cell wall-associated NlpC family hydrolase